MPTKPKTEPDTPSVQVTTAETMAGDLLMALIDEMRTAPDVWAKMPEKQQGEIIDRLRDRVTWNVEQAVALIASDDRPTVAAIVESVTFKDGVKAVLKMSCSEGAHHLADAEGDKVLVVISGADQYTGGTEGVEPDPDQTSIPDREEAA